ncbi:MAG: TspO/MBR family protein [Planctomycetota bacterium]
METANKKREAMKLLGCVVLCLFVGFIGSWFTESSLWTWYPELRKPSFTPPSEIFAPVWTALYVLMGVSLYFVARGGLKTESVRTAAVLFVIQLSLNLMWSPAFFGLRSILAGLIVISLLWPAILVTMLTFARVSFLAAVLLFPYLIWTGYAVALNLALFILNR